MASVQQNYTAIAGDTLQSIAAKYQTTIEEVAADNPGLDKNAPVPAGTLLKIIEPFAADLFEADAGVSFDAGASPVADAAAKRSDDWHEVPAVPPASESTENSSEKPAAVKTAAAPEKTDAAPAEKKSAAGADNSSRAVSIGGRIVMLQKDAKDVMQTYSLTKAAALDAFAAAKPAVTEALAKPAEAASTALSVDKIGDAFARGVARNIAFFQNVKKVASNASLAAGEAVAAGQKSAAAAATKIGEVAEVATKAAATVDKVTVATGLAKEMGTAGKIGASLAHFTPLANAAVLGLDASTAATMLADRAKPAEQQKYTDSQRSLAAATVLLDAGAMVPIPWIAIPCAAASIATGYLSTKPHPIDSLKSMMPSFHLSWAN